MKYVCPVCGYTVEADEAPAECPVCHCKKFNVVDSTQELVFADEHKVGVAQGVEEDVIAGLRENFAGECSEVGMYLAMSRQADREGYPDIAEAYKRYAFEQSEHAAKFAELLAEVLTDSTKKNLEMRIDAEHGACAGKLELAKRAKALGYDAIHDTVHEMAKDEARHGCGFRGLYKKHFDK